MASPKEQQQQQQQQQPEPTNPTVHHLSYGKSSRRDRLPTLQEVLTRKTRPPVDLYCYYLYLQRERAEDALDFWLDAHQHENLCRAYFRDLRRSGLSLQSEWPAYYDRARTRGSVYNGVKGNGVTRAREGEPVAEADTNEKQGLGRSQNSSAGGHGAPYDRTASAASSASRLASTSFDHMTNTNSAYEPERTPSPNMVSGGRVMSPTVRALFPHDAEEERVRKEALENPRQRKTSGGRPSTPAQPVIPRSSAITRQDLVASAERIWHRYLLPSAEKEIYLPPSLRIHDFPLSGGRLPSAHVGGGEQWENEQVFEAEVPDLFVRQKEYVYRSMEQDTFPRFLRAKAFGNLTPLGALLRLVAGLVCLWAALATAFALIFLDVRPRRVRFWIILPFAVGVLLVVAHFYDLDPLLMLFNRSETTPFRTLRVEEYYVRRILRGRAIWVTTLTFLLVAALCALFIAVPGRRI